jgi:hypothetical protein
MRRLHMMLASVALLALAAPAAAMTPTPSPTPTWPPTATPTATPALLEIQPAAVAASTSDINVPANAVDNNLSTRWSGYGDGAWIRLDFGSQRRIAVIAVGVYRGNERQNRFDLQASNDGTTWTNLAANVLSSGTTTQEQSYDVPDTMARYVRYLGHGSTVSLWNSVTEVSVFTYAAQSSCTVGGSQGPGANVRVTANSNLGIPRYSLTIRDTATGLPQSEADPILTPARPPSLQVSSGGVHWDLQAARTGTVRFEVSTNGEILDPACGCFHFITVTCSAGPITIIGEVTPTPTPTPTYTPTPPICPTPTAPPVPAPINLSAVGGDRRVTLSWQSGFSSTGAHTYEVHRHNPSTGNFERIATVNTSGTRDAQYVDPGLLNRTTYTYVVTELWTWTYGTPPCPVVTRTLTSPFSSPASAAAGVFETEIPISPSWVTASTSDVNVPANTVDNDLATRWSGYGDGAWLKVDLGTSRWVSHAKIAVYRGNERRNRFDIQISNDQMSWTTVFTGQSSGTTTAEEVYQIPQQPVRFIRYLGHGSNDPSKPLWNSVSEFSLFTPAAQ